MVKDIFRRRMYLRNVTNQRTSFSANHIWPLKIPSGRQDLVMISKAASTSRRIQRTLEIDIELKVSEVHITVCLITCSISYLRNKAASIKYSSSCIKLTIRHFSSKHRLSSHGTRNLRTEPPNHTSRPSKSSPSSTPSIFCPSTQPPLQLEPLRLWKQALAVIQIRAGHAYRGPL